MSTNINEEELKYRGWERLEKTCQHERNTDIPDMCMKCGHDVFRDPDLVKKSEVDMVEGMKSCTPYTP